MAIVLHVLEEDETAPATYVVACDVDAYEGIGAVTVGSLPHAKRFAHAAEAWEFWKRQSTVRPLRADGKPNRPLSALTVEFVTVPEG
jgi:hypothetical protein